MFHSHLDYLWKPPFGGRSNTKLGDHGVWNAHDRWFILFYYVWGPTWIEMHWNSIWLRARHIWLHITLEGPWPHYMILEVCWDGLWTLSFGLSQSHGHGSWLMCEVALRKGYTVLSVVGWMILGGALPKNVHISTHGTPLTTMWPQCTRIGITTMIFE